MKIITRFVLLCASAIFMEGCSIVMATKLPIARPPAELQPGMKMSFVDNRFGFPVAVGLTRDGEYAEQLQFVDGVSIGWKTARYCIHGTLDACTYCLWELIGTPIELMNRDYPVYVYYVVYDEDGVIKRVVPSDSPEGYEFSKLPWAVPFIADLKVNGSNMAREVWRAK